MALRFALVTALAPAILCMIIPLTSTLLFAPDFGVSLIGTPTRREITFDVLRAIGLGLSCTLSLLIGHALGALVGSLFRTPQIWLRYVLYWAWLQPTMLLIEAGAFWLGATVGRMLNLLSGGILLLWWISHVYVARRACRASWARTVLVVLSSALGWLLGLTAVAGVIYFWRPPVAPP